MIRSVRLLVIVLLVGTACELRSQSHSLLAQGGVPATAFTPNRGQVVDADGRLRPEILYTAADRDVQLFIRGNGISYVFNRIDDGGPVHVHEDVAVCGVSRHIVEQYRLDAELIGANPSPQVVEEDPLSGHQNFYLAHCPDGVLGVPSFRRLKAIDVWPGVDMILQGLEHGVKADFIVRPGGRVADIRIRYVAARHLSLSGNGSLTVTTPLGELVEEPPIVYQDGQEGRTVDARYVLEGDVVSLDIAPFDATVPLIVDPVRRWATYYGGANNETLGGGDPTEVDRAGNAIVAGIVDANTFPTTTGAFQTTYGGSGDAIVVKFNGSGVRQWATYYGGNGDDRAHGVVSDTGLNVIVTGHTQSSNFPVSNGAFQTTYGAGTRDAYAVKFDKDGVRQWGTYYGGNNWDDGYGFAADSAGNVALLVTTGTSGLQTGGMTAKPTAAGGYDVLVARFTAAGARDWATYIGGNSTEIAYAAGTDTSQAIIVAGWTNSNNFPTLNAAQSTFGGGADLFVAKYNRSGALQWSTYYGGTGTECDETTFGAREQGYCGLATDLAGNVFVTGLTTGGFPTTTGALQTTFAGGGRDAFLLKLNAAGARQWATYFGGSGDDVGTGVAARPDGAALMTGWTASTNLTTTTDCNVCRNQGGRDVMIVRIDSDGALDYADYYGGSSNDEGHGISFDPFGSMVVAGLTFSTNFPTQNAHQSAKGGTGTTTSDLFVMVFCDPAPPRVTPSGPINLCRGDSVLLEAADGYVSYRWNDGNTTRQLLVRQTGNYVVWARGANGCEAYSDTVRVRVNDPRRASITPGPTVRACVGDTVTLDAGASFSRYTWIPSGDTSRRHIVTSSGTFRVATVDVNGCRDTSDAVSVIISPRPDTAVISPPGPHKICEGDALVLSCSGSPGDFYTWSDGVSGQSRRVTSSGRYSVLVRNAAGCIRRSDTVSVTVADKPRPVIYSSNGSVLCKGDSLRLWTQSGFVSWRWSTGDTTEAIWVDSAGDYTVAVRDTNGCEASISFPVTVIEMARPAIEAIGGTSLCAGDTVMLVASGYFQRIVWSNGAITPRIRVADSGDYFATVFGPYNCSATSDTVHIRVNSPPRANLTGPERICASSRGTYSVERGDSLVYEWTASGAGSSIVSGAGSSSIDVQWGGAGTGLVRVKVTDRRTGCTATAELNVIIGNTLVPAVTPSGTVTLCAGESLTLDAGSGYSTYRWSTGATTRSIIVRDSGTYTVTVANAQGCSGTSLPVRVVVRALPAPAIIPSGGLTICQGGSITLSTGPFSRYEWSNGLRTRSISVTQAGTYTVTVTDTAGCRGTSAPVTVTVVRFPAITIQGATSVCRGSTVQYCIASAGSQFTWLVGGGTIRSGQGTNCIVVEWGASGSGSVDVRFTDATTGCSGDATQLRVDVATSLRPQITVIGSTDLCAGDSATLEAPPGFARYRWSTGEETRSIRVGSGLYILEVFDDGGCSGADTVSLVERPPLQPKITGGPFEFCDGDTIALVAPGGFATYQWRDSLSGVVIGTEPILRRWTPGIVVLTVTDDARCYGRADVKLTVFPQPARPSITRRGVILESSAAFGYQWLFEDSEIPGATERTYQPTRFGNHRVRITDENGCSALSEPVSGARAAARVALPSIEAAPGDRVVLPIGLLASLGLDDVGAERFTGILRFNRTLLFPTGGTPPGYIDGGDRVIPFEGRRDNGVFSVGGSSLEFIAALGDTAYSALTLDSFAFIDAEVEIGVQNGELHIVAKGGWRLFVPAGRLAIFPSIPNPAIEITTIEFETIEAGRTSLTLFDVLGRRITQLFDADATAGRHRVVIDSRMYAAGTYFLVLQTPSDRVVSSLQIAD